MGQYHHVVNLDKKEFLNPHKLGSGLKLWEQFANHPGTCAALIPLLACSNGRGGGDFSMADGNPQQTHDYTNSAYGPDDGTVDHGEVVVGRWAGDRIAIVGDYAERTDLPDEFEAEQIYFRCVEEDDQETECPAEERYRDISQLLCSFIERQLGGKFVGDGWRTFKRNERPY